MSKYHPIKGTSSQMYQCCTRQTCAYHVCINTEYYKSCAWRRI